MVLINFIAENDCKHL